MSNFVPDGWSIQELGDVTEKIEGGGTPSRTEPAYWSGDIPWVTVKDLKKVRLSFAEESISALGLKESASRLIPRNTLIIATRMALGKAVMFDRAVTINQDLKAVFPKRELDSEYLLHWYLSKAESIQSMGTGSTVKGIRLDDLRLIPIALPPLKEQQKIAAILTTVDEVIASTTAQINKLKDLKTGMMQELLTKGIGHTEFKDSPVGRIPRIWGVKTLSEVCIAKYGIVDGPFGSNLKTEHYRKNGIPVFQSGFVTSNKFVEKDYVFVDVEKYQEQIRSSAGPGDILMAKIGMNAGACAIIPLGHQVGILAGNSLKMTINEEIASNYYVLSVLHHMQNTGEIRQILTETAQPAISISTLKKMKIAIPDRSEQLEIVSMLESLDRRISTEVHRRNSLGNLKKALMQDLLTGKVRVQ